MGKIIGLSNTEDSVWYRLSPSNKTLGTLNEIFDFYEQDIGYAKKPNYKKYIKANNGERSCYRNNNEIIAYFIFTKYNANLILRKTLKWKKYQKEIDSKFKFIKYKHILT